MTPSCIHSTHPEGHVLGVGLLGRVCGTSLHRLGKQWGGKCGAMEPAAPAVDARAAAQRDVVFQHFQSVPSLDWLLSIDFALGMPRRITSTLYFQAKEPSWRKSTLQELRGAASDMAPI